MGKSIPTWFPTSCLADSDLCLSQLQFIFPEPARFQLVKSMNAEIPLLGLAMERNQHSAYLGTANKGDFHVTAIE